MSSKTSQILFMAMFLAAVLGWLMGFFLPDFAAPIKFLGIIFINALKIVVGPMLVVSIIMGVASLGEYQRSGKPLRKYLAYFFLVNGLAVAIGLVLANIAGPGLIGTETTELAAQGVGRFWPDMITSLVPSSLFQASSWGFGLGLLFISIIFGIALAALGNAGRVVTDFFGILDKALQKFYTYVLYFAPLGVLSLVANISADFHGNLNLFALKLGFYALIVVIGLIIQAAIVLPLALKGTGGKDPLQFLSNRGELIASAFLKGVATSSKNAPMIRTSDSRFAFLHRSGTALYLGVAAIFIAQAFGIALSPIQQVIIFITAIFGSIIAAGIPFAGIISLVFVLSALGLPIEGLGLILAADWLLERCRTTVDVWSDMVSHGIISETIEAKIVRQPIPAIIAVPSQSRPQKSYEPKRPRPDRPERSDRTGRGGRYDSRGRGGKPVDFQKRERRNDRGDRINQSRTPVSRESGIKDKNIPRENIEKELEKLKMQLPPIVAASENQIETKTEPPAPSKDEFFEEGIPKFDFFPAETVPPKEEKPIAPTTESTAPIPSKIEPESPLAKEPIPEPKSDEEGKEPETEDDTWGRSRKRHPTK